jgi:hypothetical protein
MRQTWDIDNIERALMTVIDSVRFQSYGGFHAT